MKEKNKVKKWKYIILDDMTAKAERNNKLSAMFRKLDNFDNYSLSII